MSQSQENCLFDSHRFTHERWGGDFSTGYPSRLFFCRDFLLADCQKTLLIFSEGFYIYLARTSLQAAPDKPADSADWEGILPAGRI
ncbi:hypothetical protein ALO_20647 [Acetonema longum DSM 6540]|uniref:Uncharacterized protein n=1 Tax=Acetonema longum DSM 6540 TaxID=1009370 RepID=F7NPT2_9FIRM|nr:hypothetical protein ALO_20647 [Acetonema longum DSM 6540]